MNKQLPGVPGMFALVTLAAWSLYMVGAMFYYGSFVIDRPYNPLGAEAQLGALLGFMYALPGLLLLSAVAWHKRQSLPRVVVLAPMVVSLAACAYFGYLRLIASTVPR